MNEALTYIDDFFRGTPGPDEKKEFEKRLQEDPAFAEEVAFYVATINVLKEDANADRRERFRNFRSVAPVEDVEEDVKVKPMRNSRRNWIYMAAASVLILITAGVIFFGNRATPQEMCDRFIKDTFSEMPVHMGGKEDSMQMALRLFNDGKLNNALEIFLSIDKQIALNEQSLADAAEIKKDIGIVYLRQEKYDNALDYFKQLEHINGIVVNYGLFYQAITLIKRNQPGDAELAKKYLDRVEELNLAGSDQAQKIRKSFR